MNEFNEKPAIWHLRAMVQRFDRCPKAFLARFSFLELWAIYRAWFLAGIGRPPHQWTKKQLSRALLGLPLGTGTKTR